MAQSWDDATGAQCKWADVEVVVDMVCGNTDTRPNRWRAQWFKCPMRWLVARVPRSKWIQHDERDEGMDGLQHAGR